MFDNNKQQSTSAFFKVTESKKRKHQPLGQLTRNIKKMPNQTTGAVRGRDTTTGGRTGKKNTRNNLPPFLKKLREITLTVPRNIAGWSEDGASFCVYDSQFETVLGKYFKGNIQTFVRQLHFYGFRKFEAQNCVFCFAHKFFLRDNPELIYNIRRKTRGDNLDGFATVEDVRSLENQVNSLEESVTDIREKLRRVSAKLGLEFKPKVTKLHPNSPKGSEKKVIKSRSSNRGRGKSTASRQHKTPKQIKATQKVNTALFPASNVKLEQVPLHRSVSNQSTGSTFSIPVISPPKFEHNNQFGMQQSNNLADRKPNGLAPATTSWEIKRENEPSSENTKENVGFAQSNVLLEPPQLERFNSLGDEVMQLLAEDRMDLAGDGEPIFDAGVDMVPPDYNANQKPSSFTGMMEP